MLRVIRPHYYYYYFAGGINAAHIYYTAVENICVIILNAIYATYHFAAAKSAFYK